MFTMRKCIEIIKMKRRINMPVSSGTSSVNVEGLENAAARMDVIAGNFEAELAALGSLVRETADCNMQGGPQASFEAKYEQFKGTMTNFISALNAYSQTTKKYAQEMRSLIDIGAQAFDSI